MQRISVDFFDVIVRQPNSRSDLNPFLMWLKVTNQMYFRSDKTTRCKALTVFPLPPSKSTDMTVKGEDWIHVSCGAFRSNHRCYELCLRKYVYLLLTGVPHMELNTFNKRKYLALIIHSSLISGYLYDNVLFKSFTLDWVRWHHQMYGRKLDY